MSKTYLKSDHFNGGGWLQNARARPDLESGAPGPFRFTSTSATALPTSSYVCSARKLRHVQVTDRHTAVDYAHVLKDFADLHFANAATIVLVQDNLNIYAKASLSEAFPATEARRLVEAVRMALPPNTAPA